MNAIVVSRRGGPEVLELKDTPVPQADTLHDEVLIDVKAAGVNFADTMQTQGTYPNGPRPPFTPGLEFAGVIHGSDERVMGFTSPELGKGSYAKHLVSKHSQLLPIPDDWSYAEAAAFPVNYFTAYFAYWMAGYTTPTPSPAPPTSVKHNRDVLIHAVAGGVGTAAVQIGRLLSVVMYGTSSSEEKLSHCRALGLDHGINYKKIDYEQEIMRLTKGVGVNAVFEMLGGEHTAKSTRCLAEFGKLIIYGNATGAPPHFDFISMFQRNAQAQGLWLTPIARHPALMREAWNAMMEWAKDDIRGRLRPVIGHELALDQTAAAHRLLLERKNYGKVVLIIV
jgi:NADPH2:quinone reductase